MDFDDKFTIGFLFCIAIMIGLVFCVIAPSVQETQDLDNKMCAIHNETFFRVSTEASNFIECINAEGKKAIRPRRTNETQMENNN